jgi:AI-2 transport protein TqsA
MGLFSSTPATAPAPPAVPTDAAGAPRADRLVRAAARLTVLVLGAAALKLGRPVLVPLVAGVFLAVLARPLARRVRDAMPRRLGWLGVTAAMLVVLAGVGAFAGGVALSGRAVAGALQERRPQLTAALDRARARAVRAGLPPSAVPALPGGDEGGDGGGAQRPGAPSGGAKAAPAQGGESSESGGGGGGVSGLASAAPRLAAGTVEALGTLLLALAFCALALAEADAVRGRLARAAPGEGGRQALAVADESAQAFRRYAWVKTLTSFITGAATWLAATALGLPLAWVWGFLAFLLEYVPSVGSVIAVVPPTLMGLADGGPSRGLLVFGTVGVLQVLLGNVVDPKIEGRLMALSPLAVLVSIAVWGWLWGAAGALLAVPLTVAAVIACRHVPGLGGVATVLAGEPGDG